MSVICPVRVLLHPYPMKHRIGLRLTAATQVAGVESRVTAPLRSDRTASELTSRDASDDGLSLAGNVEDSHSTWLSFGASLPVDRSFLFSHLSTSFFVSQ